MYISDENDYRALKKIILEKKLFRNQGKDVETHCSRFEREFAVKMNSQYSLLVTSGTNALICALNSLGIGKGDEVIIPSYTFFATAVAVINVGATPIIANIDESLMIDPKDVEKLISPNTKAIIAVHMDGHPCNMTDIVKIAKENKLYVIEDVAQAVGGRFLERPLGSIGDIGCFSFNVDKIISAGEGGAIVTSARTYFEKSLCLQDACCLFGPTHRESFTAISPFIGQSMRVSEITGALMSMQLSRLDFILENLRERKKLIKRYFQEAEIPVVASWDEEGDCGSSIYLSFDSIEEVKYKLQKINIDKALAIPLTAKPAHVCWQWMHLLAEVRPKNLYNKFNFLNSIDIVSRTAKLDIPFDLSLDETKFFAQNLVKKLKD